MTTRDFLKLPIADQLHHLAILNRDAYDKRDLWRRGLSRAAGTEAKKLTREAERLKSALRTKAAEQARREPHDGSL
ncbi:MAG: hypothetical protein K0U79_15090 [Gammaproteobacteria bacterium]|nr:hypothetical protein [Gammaproteobacteria bacterium]